MGTGHLSCLKILSCSAQATLCNPSKPDSRDFGINDLASSAAVVLVLWAAPVPGARGRRGSGVWLSPCLRSAP